MPSRSIRFTYSVTLPEQSERERIRIWLPRARTTPHQEVVSWNVRSPFPQQQMVEKQFQNEGLYFEPPPSREQRVIEIEYVITRHARQSAPWSDVANAEYSDDEVREQRLGPYLSANLNVPTDGFIAYQARTVASMTDSPVERARRVFEHLIETLEYDWAGCTPDRIADLGNLKKACDLRTGTCTEFHGLYVGYMRALHVPAQFIFGFNVPNQRTSGPIAGYHCWAEVQLPRIGWFPVDVSEAWKQPEKRDTYFGGLDSDRVEFHVGRDLMFVPEQSTAAIDKWIFGHAERDGQAFALDVSFRFEDVAP